MAGARAKGRQTEQLRCAWVGFGEVPLGPQSPLPREMGFGGNLPSADVEELQGLSPGPGCGQESVQGSLQTKAFDEQDILKSTWALSVLEFLLLVFKSLSCGEKCLLSAKTQRALEEKNLCVNQEKTRKSKGFWDPLRKKLISFFLSSLSPVQSSLGSAAPSLLAVDKKQSFLWEKGRISGRSFVSAPPKAAARGYCWGWAAG